MVFQVPSALRELILHRDLLCAAAAGIVEVAGDLEMMLVLAPYPECIQPSGAR